MKAHIKNRVPKGKYKTYHLTRALSLHEIKKITCKTISCSPSTFNRLSKRVKSYLSQNKYKIKIETNKGKPLQNNPKIILRCIKLYRSGKSLRNIEKETGVAKSTIHYLIKYARKTKIKKGSIVITV